MPVYFQLFLREKPRYRICGIEPVAKIGNIVEPHFSIFIRLKPEGRALEDFVVGVLVERE